MGWVRFVMDLLVIDCMEGTELLRFWEWIYRFCMYGIDLPGLIFSFLILIM